MIKIFTDTAANLPFEISKSYGIEVVQFKFWIDGKECCFSEDWDDRAFYEVMRNGGEVSTSLINTQTFESAFKKALDDGYDIIYVGMSSGISGTVGAGKVAADELRKDYPERKIGVVDTLAASLGEGFFAIEAAKMACDGMDFDEILSCLEKNKWNMCQYFTVDDLKYLRKGGRISAAKTLIGNALNIKPILMGDDEGRIVQCAKTRGMKRALSAIAEKYEELCTDKSANVGIAHGDNEEDSKLLVEMIREKGFCGECLMTYYEPVTGSHVGPGTVAFFFWGEHK